MPSGADIMKQPLQAIYNHALSTAKISKVVENISEVRIHPDVSFPRLNVHLARCMSHCTTRTFILA